MIVSAIVLAAGESRRMGRAKMTLPWGESTILGTVIGSLAKSEVAGITVVLGRNWEEVYPTVQHLGAQVVVNPRPESGMLSSVKWGLAHIRDDAAALFALGDQPRILPATVNALIRAAESSECGILLPSFHGRRGHPLLVKNRYRRAILDLPESGGLNQLLDQYHEDVLEVESGSESVLMDIDTPEDYEESLRG